MRVINRFCAFAIYFIVLLAVLQCGGQVNSRPYTNAQQSNSVCNNSGEFVITYKIEAGNSVGEIQLGATVENTLAMLKSRCLEPVVVYHPDYKYMDASISTGDEMINNYTKGSGIRYYFMKDRLFQVSVDSYLYSDSDITKNSPISTVMKKYPDGQAFHLEPSAQDGSEIKKLSYWVVEKKGVAFEFYETPEKLKLISSIYVFPPNNEFFPLGTLDAPEFLFMKRSSTIIHEKGICK